MDQMVPNWTIVKDSAWIPHHDLHLSIESQAKICKGMLPEGAPEATSIGPSSDTVEQATNFICTVNIQTPKGDLFALGEPALLVASWQKPSMARPYIFGRPLFSKKSLNKYHHKLLTST